MFFHDLDEDVLTGLLFSCDIYTVLSFSRVNKSFRRLALSKQLWLSLVLDLSSRYLIPHLDALHDCTTAQLIAKVKWLLCGPETWARRSSTPPTVSFSKTFRPGNAARLLLGGHYIAVLLESSGDLHCFEMLTGREVYFPGLLPNATSWEIEMLDDGQTAILLVHRRSNIGLGPELSLTQVNLRTGHSDVFFHVELNRHVGVYANPTVSDDFLALGLENNLGQRMVVVINWRERKYLVFDGSGDSGYSHIAASEDEWVFVPGHIILTTVASEPPNDQLLVVYPLRSNTATWRPLEELLQNSEHLLPVSVSPIMAQRLEHNKRVFRVTVAPTRGVNIRMMLYPNPIRHNAYKLMVYASAWDTRSSPDDTFRQDYVRGRGRKETGRAQGAVLFTYSVHAPPQLSSNPGASGEYSFSWTRRSSTSIAPQALCVPLSYAGYAVICSSTGFMSGITKIVDPRITDRFLIQNEMREVAVVEQGLLPTSLSSHGVLLLRKHDKIQIVCYV
ncbi:hypothetical protein C8R45DRAFT_1010822 [Mycena sanguinolenta]|nr:hypothetical protein C8R45DRAFT_1010822 [Mycena sanguinolenta]